MKTNQSTLREKIKDGIEEKKKLKDEKRKQNPKSEGYHEKILKL